MKANRKMDTEKILKIGRSDFGWFIRNGYYLVDKTLLIYDFHHNPNDIVLFPRPKRFGKTLNLSMVQHFYDLQKDGDSALFAGLEIAQKKEFCKEHQNKYPVIHISLKGIKETTWDKWLNQFKNVISKVYEDHDFLLASDQLKEYEKQLVEKLIYKTADETEYKAGLVTLSKYLEKHFGQKVIILTDEYDTPIISAFNNTNRPIKSADKENKTYYEKVVNFMQGFLGDAYKENDALFKGMITGVMRVGIGRDTRPCVSTEWNNFDVFGITMPYFSEHFGFTNAETEKILNDFNLATKIEEVKQWYDGYKFGEANHIYNPWSIVNYIAKHKAGFKPYWINSGDYSLIKNRMIEIGISDEIQELMEGKLIEKELHDNFVFQDFETDRELFWTLLTDNGYLTQVGEGDFGSYQLKIPNKEVRIAFTSMIKTWINTEVKLTRNLLANMAKSLIHNDAVEFEQRFRQVIGDTLSYFDTSEKTEQQGKTKVVRHEQIYHVYTLGLLTILADDYIIKSNRESGGGRYDIMLIPYDKTGKGVVIEIKSIEKRKKNEEATEFAGRVNKALSEALGQIDANKYYAELIENKVKPVNIIKRAIVFAGKEPYINQMN